MFHQTVFPFETFHIIPRRHNCLVQVVICTGHLPVIFSLPLPRFATCDLKTKISLSDGPLKKLRPKEGVRGGGGRGGGGGRFRAEAKKKKFPRKILIENIYLPTYSGQKNMCPSWKIHIYTFPSFIYKYTQKKNLASLKIPTPLPHHFSNGPSLTFTFFASVIHSNGPLRKHSLSLAGSLAGDICRCNWLISSMFFISFHGKYD